MKTLADVVADHVSSVLSSVDSAARVMGVRAYSDARDRQVYLSAASDVLTATAPALGLPAEFAPALPPPAPRLPAGPQVKLSTRERQIAVMIVAGKMRKEIAHDLGLSSWTIKSHTDKLYRKTEVHDHLAFADWWRANNQEVSE